MFIPCDKNTHWTHLYLGIPFKEEEFDFSGFAEKLGRPSLEKFFFVADDKNAACHSSFQVDALSNDNGKGFLIAINTFMEKLRERDIDSGISHTRFMTVFRESINVDKFYVFAEVDLVFSAESTKLRLPLLSDPPELTPFLEGTLGRIVLTGITLRFEDSQAGLYESRIDVNTEEKKYYLQLRFVTRMPKGESEFYKILIDKAEKFAELFVDIINKDDPNA